MIRCDDTEDVKRWMDTYYRIRSLTWDYTDETRRLLVSAREIPEELRDKALKERIEKLEKMLTPPKPRIC